MISDKQLSKLSILFPPLRFDDQHAVHEIAIYRSAKTKFSIAELYLPDVDGVLLLESPAVILDPAQQQQLISSLLAEIYDLAQAEALIFHVSDKGNLHFSRRITHPIWEKMPFANQNDWAIGFAFQGGEGFEFLQIFNGEDRGVALNQARYYLDRLIIKGDASRRNLISAVLASDRFERADMGHNFMAEEYPDGFGIVDLGIGHSRHISALGCILEAITEDLTGLHRWTAQVNDDHFFVELDIKPTHIVAAIDEDSDKATIEINVETQWKAGQKVAEFLIDERLMIIQQAASEKGYIITYRGGYLDVKLAKIDEKTSFVKA